MLEATVAITAGANAGTTGGSLRLASGSGSRELSSGNVIIGSQNAGVSGSSGSAEIRSGQSGGGESGKIRLSTGASEDTSGSISMSAGASPTQLSLASRALSTPSWR